MMNTSFRCILLAAVAASAGCRGSLFESWAARDALDRLSASSEHFDPITASGDTLHRARRRLFPKSHAKSSAPTADSPATKSAMVDSKPSPSPSPALSRVESAEAALQRGRQAEASGQLELARSSYQEALELRPTLAEAHHRLAVIADKQRNFGDAERHYRAALAATPRDADLLSDFGYSCFLQNRLAESESALQQALQVSPHHERAWNNLGLVHARRGHQELALDAFRRTGTEAEARARLRQLLGDSTFMANSTSAPGALGNAPAARLADVNRQPVPSPSSGGAMASPGVPADPQVADSVPRPQSPPPQQHSQLPQFPRPTGTIQQVDLLWPPGGAATTAHATVAPPVESPASPPHNSGPASVSAPSPTAPAPQSVQFASRGHGEFPQAGMPALETGEQQPVTAGELDEPGPRRRARQTAAMIGLHTGPGAIFPWIPSAEGHSPAVSTEPLNGGGENSPAARADQPRNIPQAVDGAAVQPAVVVNAPHVIPEPYHSSPIASPVVSGGQSPPLPPQSQSAPAALPRVEPRAASPATNAEYLVSPGAPDRDRIAYYEEELRQREAQIQTLQQQLQSASPARNSVRLLEPVDERDMRLPYSASGAAPAARQFGPSNGLPIVAPQMPHQR